MSLLDTRCLARNLLMCASLLKFEPQTSHFPCIEGPLALLWLRTLISLDRLHCLFGLFKFAAKTRCFTHSQEVPYTSKLYQMYRPLSARLLGICLILTLAFSKETKVNHDWTGSCSCATRNVQHLYSYLSDLLQWWAVPEFETQNCVKMETFCSCCSSK